MSKSIQITESLIKDDHHITLVEAIVIEAEERFKQCGREDDFCLQCCSGDNITFGGWNRVIWSPRRGWTALESHCTEKFLNAWNEHYTGEDWGNQ